MRRRCTALALTTVLAAGCSSGHGAAPPPWARHAGVYSAVIAGRLLHSQHGAGASPPQRILFDTATGRFRIDMTGGSRLHGCTMHTVSDGRMATQVVAASGRAEVTAYRGSPAFIFDQLGGIDVRVVRDFLSGAPPPPGVRVRIVSDGPPARLVATTGLERLQLTIAAVHRPAAGDFRAARGHLSSRITLSGTAVTDASALFIARALRPL